jgi:hypothetical protein
MGIALQDADSHDLPHTSTARNHAQSSLLQSPNPTAPQSPLAVKHAALCQVEAMELPRLVEELVLPPEILSHVFSFVSPHLSSLISRTYVALPGTNDSVCSADLDLTFGIENMTNIRLVCPVWKAIVARQIWGILITDFQPSNKQDLDILLDPKSGTFPHVRQLIVCKVPTPFLVELEAALRRLLECMPRGSLRAFLSLPTLSPTILKDLIAWHPRLERLEAFVNPVTGEFKQCD